ncbi:MAG: hypothetical protein ACXVCY_13600 [Pseudobdellovibrionaceae bacterium]
MNKLTLILLLIFLNSAVLADQNLNICNRGPVAELIAEIAEAKNCSSVSLDKLHQLKVLIIANSNLHNIPANAFEKLTSLKTLLMDSNKMSSILSRQSVGLAESVFVGVQIQP